MFCSSSMLVVNKVAISLFPAQNLLLILQLASSATFLWIMGMMKIFPVDPLDMNKVKQSWMVASVFLLNIYTNVMALKSCNVETVIVFRSLTTVFIAIGDARVLQGKQRPKASVLICLLSIVVCTLFYVRSESTEMMHSRSYFWLFAYMFAQTADCLYIKHNVNTVNMSSWGRSYYNNVLALGPLSIPWILSEDESWEHLAQQVSATSYSVIGNMNKVLTIIINYTIWKKHASELGLFWLLGCLVSGYAYSVVQDK
ncbi:hypothetical protein GUITHDRAFT_114526 [Guillardia theta CCMP2712]|uniref:Sugar phosphate transporter domain-containing protein n=1 Tax=Guillardia theta (strain CCMP2712) TaxID=905079 RepID=L1IU30_GUITC|nr:hypothetical protein GUITHDRAFT_114526 [Guillardia theta CCMP2712]EKX39325.1 hypothetical protein GUITHDRAFT_114526 [Guillardia theta CCMP2712]|eukprot:XP_005826305.1 hypothetical protein GUITHDRAFT_114526 [Guillardia theta CCMP2712]